MAAPFLRLHFSAREDEQIAIQECIGGTRSGQQEANCIAALLQVILEPTAQCLIDFSVLPAVPGQANGHPSALAARLHLVMSMGLSAKI